MISDDESVDEDHAKFEEMAAGIDEYYNRQKEYKMEIDRQLQKKEKKRKALIEQQRLKKEDVSEEDELNNEDLMARPAKRGVKFSEDVVMEESDDDGLFVNPLSLKKEKNGKKKTSDDEGFSSADEDDEKMQKKEA